jgi:hypothetical protein
MNPSDRALRRRVSARGGIRVSPADRQRLLLTAVFFLLGWGALYYLTGAVCWIKAVFGVPCPGCGTIRAFTALVRGDWSGALRWHPLIPVTVLILPLVLAGELLLKPGRRKKMLHMGCFCLSVLYAAVFIVRMAAYFPHAEPLTVYRNTFGRLLLKAIAFF